MFCLFILPLNKPSSIRYLFIYNKFRFQSLQTFHTVHPLARSVTQKSTGWSCTFFSLRHQLIIGWIGTDTCVCVIWWVWMWIFKIHNQMDVFSPVAINCGRLQGQVFTRTLWPVRFCRITTRRRSTVYNDYLKKAWQQLKTTFWLSFLGNERTCWESK